MAIQTYAGNFMTGVGIAGTNVVVAGLPFQPECVIFWVLGHNTNADFVGNEAIKYNFGAALSSTVRRCSGIFESNGHGVSWGSRITSDDCIFAFGAEGGGALFGKLDFVSMDANGFTTVIDLAFATTVCVFFLAIRGYSHYAMGSLTEPGATGNMATVGLGFQPNGEIFCGAGNTAWNTNDYPGYEIGIGAATDAGHQACVLAQGNGSVNTKADYSSNVECFAIEKDSNNPGPFARFAFVSQDIDGFTLNCLERSGSNVFWYLAFGGPDGTVFVDDFLTRTDGNDIPVGTGFRPAGMCFFSTAQVMPADDVDQNGSARLSIGGASSEALRSVAAFYSEQTNPTDINVTQQSDAVYGSLTTAGAIDGLMDVKSFDPTGFTAVMDDPDAAAAFIFVVAFGPANWENRRRVVTYTRDTMDPDPRLKDANGVYLDPWECHADAWVKILSVFSPTTNVPASLVDDPEAGYIEELGWSSDDDAPKFFTSRMDLGETVIAQAAAKSAG